MSARTLVEFRKTLSSAHRKHISVAMRKRNSLKKKPLETSPTSRSFLTEENLDKVIDKADRVADIASKVARTYTNVARANKDIVLARRYQEALRPKSGLQILGEAFDSGVRRSDTISRIGTRVVGSTTSGVSRLGSVNREATTVAERFNRKGIKLGSTKTTVSQGLGLLGRFL